MKKNRENKTDTKKPFNRIREQHYEGGRYHAAKSLDDISPVIFLKFRPENDGVVGNKPILQKQCMVE